VRLVSEATWPTADVIVGNPPFLGGSKKSGELGREYFDALNHVYDQHVPGGADLVCYWFHKALKQIVAGQLRAAGLVSTQSIRAGSNRKVLEAIVADTRIFEAWSDEEWVNDGAAVRVSLLGFGPIFPVDRSNRLDGLEVTAIHADLTGGGAGCVDLTLARVLAENAKTIFLGTKKSGAFDIPGSLARSWLSAPNPHSQPNSNVIRPWANGQDIVGRPLDKWIIDFGTNASDLEASYFQEPFEYVVKEIKSEREKNNRLVRAKYWWRLAETMPAMRKAVANLARYITTVRVAKHRTFVWKSTTVLPDDRLAIIARADDVTFGVISSRFHELWSMANVSMHGDGNTPTYNNKSCFETFPFPAGLTPRDTIPSPALSGTPLPPAGEGLGERAAVAETIAVAARRLNELREAWLNPAEWVDWVITPEEEKAGFPQRPVAKPGHEADLKKRTLTNLYNARPAWLDLAHKELDKAVASAYGWTDYTAEMPDDEILRRLLALNLERSQLPHAK
jgi:type II restriction/modification system DNA methylase subunit YeeA